MFRNTWRAHRQYECLGPHPRLVGFPWYGFWSRYCSLPPVGSSAVQPQMEPPRKSSCFVPNVHVSQAPANEANDRHPWMTGRYDLAFEVQELCPTWASYMGEMMFWPDWIFLPGNLNVRYRNSMSRWSRGTEVNRRQRVKLKQEKPWENRWQV